MYYLIFPRTNGLRDVYSNQETAAFDLQHYIDSTGADPTGDWEIRSFVTLYEAYGALVEDNDTVFPLVNNLGPGEVQTPAPPAAMPTTTVGVNDAPPPPVDPTGDITWNYAFLDDVAVTPWSTTKKSSRRKAKKVNEYNEKEWI